VTPADIGGLFERVPQLQYAPVVVMTANDLDFNGKSAVPAWEAAMERDLEATTGLPSPGLRS
jgi:hypothetical protein